jgi:nicotinamidase-related amidase
MAVNHPSSDAYAKSGFANRMGWGSRPALLIIDVCQAYWLPSSPLSLLGNPDAEAVPESIRRLLKAAREAKVPVVWSEVEYTQPDMSDAGLFWRKSKVLDVWKKGDPRGLAAHVEGIEPEAGETVIVKKYASAFFGTALATDLHVGHSSRRSLISAVADRMTAGPQY